MRELFLNLFDGNALAIVQFRKALLERSYKLYLVGNILK